MMTRRGGFDWNRVRQEMAHNEALIRDVTVHSPEKLETEFRRRAERLAQRSRHDSVGRDRLELLAFRLAGERYGIELSRVLRVSRHVNCSPVPGAPDYLKGVANLQGEVRSVIDLRPILNLAGTTDAQGHVLLVSWGSKEIGLWIESVEEIEHAEMPLPNKADEQLEGDLGPYLFEVTRKHTIVLDLDAIIEAISHRTATKTAAGGKYVEPSTTGLETESGVKCE